MRLLLTWTIWITFFHLICAQQSPWETFKHCGFDHYHHKKLLENRTYLESSQDLEERWVSNTITSRKRPYTLPVVVHIIHNNGAENITDTRVSQAITYLNDAFANRNYYNPNTGIDTEIEFCLAQRTPNNQITSGITRTVSTLTDLDMDNQDVALKDLSRWDPLNYINIWVVNEICNASGCGVAGYAFFPSAHGQDFDGIVIEAAFMGSSPTDNTVLVHEMGHYLGLYHTFQGGCPNNNCLSEGDRICDTPPDQTTARTVCSDQINSCDTDEDDSSTNNPFRAVSAGGLGDQDDQFQNYMDYSRLECYDQFTPGQKDRMIFSIEYERQSLINSASCLSPCPAMLTTQISASSNTVTVGQTINFNAISTNADGHNWTINNLPLASTQNTSYTFNTVGMDTIILEALSNDPNCRNAKDTLIIEVLCTATADLSYALTGTTISLMDQSTAANEIQWSILESDGTLLFMGNNAIENYTFNNTGWYNICLEAIADLCVSDTCFFVQIFIASNEDCGNGIDDDGDGWIDYFDPDCPEDDSLYMAQPDVECNVELEVQSLDIKAKWTYDVADVYADMKQILVGDIDQDGETEIVSLNSKTDFMNNPPTNDTRVIVLDGKTGTLLDQSAQFDGWAEHMCMADTDGDGFAEIFVVTHELCEIYAFDHQLNLLWNSNLVCDPLGLQRRNLAPNLADINADGIPELYIGATVINAQNGQILVDVPLVNPGNEIFMSVAADFIPALPGQEIAFGTSIYSYQLNNLNGQNGNTWTVQSVLSGNQSHTSIADIDDDGMLDIIAIEFNAFTSGEIVVWNPRNLSVIASTNIAATASIIFCGDVDNDCRPEIGYTTNQSLVMLEYDGTTTLDTKYTRTTTDGSGRTGITMFDFNQDGSQELIYRDESLLRIMNGETGQNIIAIPLRSFTWFEYPIVADIDGDQEAEIITASSYIQNSALRGGIASFESDVIAWAPARPVWNQPSYYVTNVNDDLTIPRHPQNIANKLTDFCNCSAPYNAFLTQATYRTRPGCPINPAFDAEIEIVDISCDPDSLTIQYRLHNLADFKNLPSDIVIGVYDANPLTNQTTALGYEVLGIEIEPGKTSPLLSLRTAINNVQGYLYLLANTAIGSATPFSLPLTNRLECNYENNLDSIPISIGSIDIDLGPDTTMCSNGIVSIEAPEGYASYLWSDGTSDRTYTAFEDGIHWVEVSNICGQTARDTIAIMIDPITELEILADTIYCKGDSIRLKSTHLFDEYQWFGLGSGYCDQCPELVLAAEEDLSIVLRVENENGCFDVDSIHIQVRDSFLIEEEYQICPGDSIFVVDNWLFNEGEYLFELPSDSGCDSTLIVEIIYNEHAAPFDLGNDTLLCEQTNLSLSVEDLYAEYLWQDSSTLSELSIDSSGIYWLRATDDCNLVYTDTIQVSISDTFLTTQNLILCEGDSIWFENDWIKNSGTFYYRYDSELGCDSTIELVVKDHFFENYLEYDVFCDPAEVVVEFIGDPSQAIIWPDSSTGTSYISTGGETIQTTVTDVVSGCVEQLSISVPSIPDLVVLPSFQDTQALLGNGLSLDLDLDPMIWEVLWLPEDGFSCPTCMETEIISNTSPVSLRLTHIETGCVYQMSFEIDWEEAIYVPNSFSPNGDNNNDRWEIHFGPNIDRVSMVLVYNRWGDLVVEWNEEGAFFWDGTFNGHKAEAAVYAYYIKLVTQQGGIIVKKGDLTLMR